MAMGFVPENGKKDIFIKSYPSHSNYSIRVDFSSKTIDYGKKIKKGSKTTSNFYKDENFVVLECVDRLLEKEYKPQHIYLEKNYPAGRGVSKGLDILVYDNKSPYLMIECKTWETQHKKEYNKMLKDGGQLFTYYGFDRETKYLCLYSSQFENNEIKYKNDIVAVEDGWKMLSNTPDIFEQWSKQYKSNGVFEEHSTPYNVKSKKLTYNDLKNLTKKDSSYIYNQFEEILRHNAVSDKQNAFNKLLNLLICKIKDEDRNKDSILKFQVLEGQSDEDLQMELNILYKGGMYDYLGQTVTLHTREDIEKDFELKGISDTDLVDMQWKRLKDNTLKSPRFSFKELDSDKSFVENAKIVREIVSLLQEYKFRYQQKHQFLGSFFEKLLKESIKQEVGQYFTPVDIAKFIIYSLPLREYMEEKIEKQKSSIIPTAIDFACGSGHFLIEYMEVIQNLIQKIEITNASTSAKNKVSSWRNDVKFAWAKDYVYGIDNDDRLVKTTKVAAFLNGDGEANILWGNGLDNFHTSRDYIKVLKNPTNDKNNGNFDVLISNPPYSVKGFKGTLDDGSSSFDLFNGLTEKSKEIECLFVERMKQLLKIDGIAAIVLPTSILTNSRLHSKAREIILKYFYIKAIVELKADTFAATPTKTIILFLKRRNDGDFIAIEREINDFFVNKNDVAVNKIESAFSKFVSNVYENLSFDDYLKFIKGQNVEHELCKDYYNAFNDDLQKVINLEKEKMLYFFLTYPQKIVLVKTGEEEKGKKFLGFWFSNRRGKGEVPLPTGTQLFNISELMDSTKANSYIYNAFKNNFDLEIADNLSEHISYAYLSSFIEYGTNSFDRIINLNKKDMIIFQSAHNKKLGDYVYIIKGVTYDKEQQVLNKTKNIILTADNITVDNRFEMSKMIYLSDDLKLDNTKKLMSSDVFISLSSGSKKHVGKCAHIKSDTNYYAGGFMGVIRPKEEKKEEINMKYLHIILSHPIIRNNLSNSSTGSNINNLSDNLYDLKIPLPPMDVQKKIVDEFVKAEKKMQTTNDNISSSQTNIKDIIGKCFSSNLKTGRLGDIIDNDFVKRGKSAKYGSSNMQIIKSGQARGLLEFDFTERHYVDEKFISDERNLIKGDILINSTGVGTAGRVTLFDLDGDFVVDSHITIVRLNKNEALPKYVLYALYHIGFKTIEAMATGQSGQVELSPDTIKGIRIPLPSLPEQKKIIAEIEKYEAEIAKAKTKLEDLEQKKNEIIDKYL